MRGWCDDIGHGARDSGNSAWDDRFNGNYLGRIGNSLTVDDCGDEHVRLWCSHGDWNIGICHSCTTKCCSSWLNGLVACKEDGLTDGEAVASNCALIVADCERVECSVLHSVCRINKGCTSNDIARLTIDSCESRCDKRLALLCDGVDATSITDTLWDVGDDGNEAWYCACNSGWHTDKGILNLLARLEAPERCCICKRKGSNREQD